MWHHALEVLRGSFPSHVPYTFTCLEFTRFNRHYLVLLLAGDPGILGVE
jgi:hypothetical protein